MYTDPKYKSDLKYERTDQGFKTELLVKGPGGMFGESKIIIYFDMPYEEFRVLLREFIRVDAGHDIKNETKFVKVVDKPGVFIMLYDFDFNVYYIMSHGIRETKPIGYITRMFHSCQMGVSRPVRYIDGILFCDNCGDIQADQ